MKLALAAAIGLAASAANAQPVPRYGMVQFSSLCLDRQGGDVGGERVTLIRRGDGDTLLYEWSEGPLYGPAVGENVQIVGREWRAQLIIDDKPAPFHARLSEDGRSLTVDPVFKGTSNPARLGRMADLSKPLPDCR